VLTAFALAIVADAQPPAYPGIPGHEPSVEKGRKFAKRIDQCVNQLRAVAPHGGAYVSESNYFEKGFQQSYWGTNYRRLAKSRRSTIRTGCSSCTTESVRNDGAATASRSCEPQRSACV
jgi:hypothetical protein